MIEQKSRIDPGITPPVANMSQTDMPIGKALFGALKDQIEPRSVPPGQRIILKQGSAPQICILDTGMLMLSARRDDDCRTVLSLLYEGDISCGLFTGPLKHTKLTAQLSSRYIVLPLGKFEEMLSDNPDFIPLYTKTCSRLLARQALHTSSLIVLTCEQKLATLLIELSLNIGRTANKGISVEVPLTRRDIADYLALNVDTVSRTMSLFKNKGLVASVGRHHVVILRPKGLMERTPLGNELVEMHMGSPCAPLFL